MGESDRLRGAVATVVSIDTSDTIAAPPETPRARPWRSREPVRPDHDELPTIDPSHYVFATEIARGGMGRIAIARDLRLGREVAVKEIIAESDDLDRRFEREVRITARLQHPSIVSVHE
ncbi:MAG TPA: hypothetical protein VGO00_18340, partial [Kofleriaceae bacterium]|nr:hypothetical protein [Kofleriaceae bacterium]